MPRQYRARVVLHPAVLNFELPWVPAVIRVEKSNIRPRGRIPACIAGMSRPSVRRQRQHLDPASRVFRRNPSERFRSAIPTAIVDEYDLPREHRLSRDRLESAEDRPAAAVARNYHADGHIPFGTWWRGISVRVHVFVFVQ